MAKKTGRAANNEGSIYFRESRQKWVYEYIVTDSNGKDRKKTKSFDTQKEAVKFKSIILHKQLNGRIKEPKKMTFGLWLDQWMELYQAPNVAPSTYDLRLRLIRLHIKPTLGKIALQDLKVNDLQKLYKSRLEAGKILKKEYDSEGKEIEQIPQGLSTQTVRHIHNTIHGALNQAVINDYIPKNVAKGVKLPPVKNKEIKPYHTDQVKEFLAACQKHRLYAAFLLDLNVGLRRGELLGLYWSDIDLSTGISKVRRQLLSVRQKDGSYRLELGPLKSSKSYRTIILPQILIKELKSHKARQAEEKLKAGEHYEKDCALVFATQLGKPLNPRRFTRTYEGLTKKAGIDYVSFHNLRHTAATLLLKSGQDIKTIQDMLGHKNAETTLNTYAGVLDEMKQGAADKLDEIFESLVPKKELTPKKQMRKKSGR